MPRAILDKSLTQLKDDMLCLGSMVEKAIDQSVEALKRRDLVLAQQVINNDQAINMKRFEIEEGAVDLIATQQPMAGDLRTILTILNIIYELERIADHAEGIGKIVLLIGDEPPIKPLIDIPRMTQKAISMLRRSLTAFMERDVEVARQICDEDDEVDALTEQVYRELLLFMMQDARTVTQATRLIWVSHNLERIADRVTNICERVVFMVAGKYEELNISKY
jgi:phosphate transport system protein